MNQWEVASHLAAVSDRIARACVRAGRAPETVTLVGVTKKIALAKVVAGCRAGLWDLGENRIQDALPRQAELAAALNQVNLDPTRVRWHFIGHLQRNKAAKAIGAFHLIHAVDSLKLATHVSERARALATTERVLIEVNVTAEPQKHGVASERTVELVAQAAELPHLEPLGLMTMARFGASSTELHQTFASLRRLREEAGAVTGLPLPHLSMGMSDDFEEAILEGATIVRIGTAIFGPRSGG